MFLDEKYFEREKHRQGLIQVKQNTAVCIVVLMHINRIYYKV